MTGFSPYLVNDRIIMNGYLTLGAAEVLVPLGVTHIVNLDRPYPSEKPFTELGFEIRNIRMVDMAPIAQETARRVVETLSEILGIGGAKVYVHCSAGLNRAPTAIWLYFVAKGYSQEDAAELLRAANRALQVPNQLLVSELDINALSSQSKPSSS
jgi:protein-tyrosine phosphatase